MTTKERAQAAQAELAGLFDRCEHAILGFSGGKESIVLADLVEPWRDRVTLLWTNTGHMAPHMAEFVREYGQRFRFEEIAAPNIEASWREHGTPAEVLPSIYLDERAGTARLQPWQVCCSRIRWQPALDAVAEAAFKAGKPMGYINGQRREDVAVSPETLKPQLPPIVEGLFPLWEWSTADVFAYVDDRGLTLPHQYAEGLDSIECLPCPAMMTVGRLRYIRREHPEAAEIAEKAMLRALEPSITTTLRMVKLLDLP